MTGIAFLLFFFVSISAIAQEIVIKGKVIETNGNPIIGASVVIKGTTTAVLSDANGNYSIKVPDANAVLVVNYVGYTSQEIPVGSQTTIDFKLSEEVTHLNDVVITAMGIKKEGKTIGYSTRKLPEATW